MNSAGIGATDLFVEVMFDELWRAAEEVGIDPVGMIAQSLKETGFGTFAGAVREWFHNPAGIKVRHAEEVLDLLGVGDQNHPLVHQMFPNWRVGAVAHAQRLLDYCLLDVAQNTCGMIVDPRHGFGNRGILHWEELGGRWAGSPTYGEEVADLMRRLAGES